MYKLVLHHTYNLEGEAIDISGCDNHGRRTGTTLTTGRSSGTKALYFEGRDDMVSVPVRNSLKSLGAIQAEAWICIDDLSKRRNIIEGSLSFALFVHPDGVLWGTFYDPDCKSPVPPGFDPTWTPVNSDAPFSPDGMKHTVPLNEWTHVKYVHDGVASARLYINNVLVGANYNIQSSVRSIDGGSLAIGHWPPPNDDRYTMHGSIDEVKLWKYDPDVMTKQFYCRPMNSRQFKCWGTVFNNIKEQASGENGRSLIGFLKCIMKGQVDLTRSIRCQGETAMEEQNLFAKSYQELWCKGDIAGDHMRELLHSYALWLKENTTDEERIRWGKRFQGCFKEYKMGEKLKDMNTQVKDCDPQFMEFLNLVLIEWGELFGISAGDV